MGRVDLRVPRQKQHACMAIATERDLCGKTARYPVVAVIAKNFVPIWFCAKHCPPEYRANRQAEGKR